MPFSLNWESRGVYRRYHGDVTVDERLESFETICASPRFDELRWCITDYLEVRHYELSDEATQEIAALHIAPLHTNPRLRIAAVAVQRNILQAIDQFKATGFVHLPYEVFPTVAQARAWVGPLAVR